jgi:hypothetical protein
MISFHEVRLYLLLLRLDLRYSSLEIRRSWQS